MKPSSDPVRKTPGWKAAFLFSYSFCRSLECESGAASLSRAQMNSIWLGHFLQECQNEQSSIYTLSSFYDSLARGLVYWATLPTISNQPILDCDSMWEWGLLKWKHSVLIGLNCSVLKPIIRDTRNSIPEEERKKERKNTNTLWMDF